MDNSNCVSSVNIFLNSVTLVFANFKKFMSAIAAPVWGQLCGIFLIFGAVWLWSNFIIKFAGSGIASITTLIVLLIPGFFLFMKAFWGLITATVGICYLTKELENSNPNAVALFKEYQKKRFVWLLTLLAFPAIFILGVVGLCLALKFIFTGFGGFIIDMIMVLSFATIVVFYIYMSLAVSIFAVEENTPVVDIICKSYKYINKNIKEFLKLILLTTILTLVISFLISIIIETFYALIFPSSSVYRQTSLIISSVLSAFTLPFYFAPFTLWYLELKRES